MRSKGTLALACGVKLVQGRRSSRRFLQGSREAGKQGWEAEPGSNQTRKRKHSVIHANFSFKRHNLVTGRAAERLQGQWRVYLHRQRFMTRRGSMCSSTILPAEEVFGDTGTTAISNACALATTRLYKQGQYCKHHVRVQITRYIQYTGRITLSPVHFSSHFLSMSLSSFRVLNFLSERLKSKLYDALDPTR